ncbi:MAG TPA: helix-turn-helix domain-containing protein [Bryobacteraceae bacterium]|nr:helix-turn-helix domain-containing protein [Bryobacteraceae bacterium]
MPDSKPKSETPSEVWLPRDKALANLARSIDVLQRHVKAGHIRKRGLGATAVYNAQDILAVRTGAHKMHIESGGQAAAAVPLQAQADAWSHLAGFLANLTKTVAEINQQAALPAPEPAAEDVPPFGYLSVAEAARLVRMPRSWILEQIESGRLAYAVTSRGGYRVRRADLEAMPAPERVRKHAAGR